jgi:hypothetical protein
MRHEFGDRLAIFRDDDCSASASDLVHQGKAFSFELGSFDIAGHAITMVMTTAI